MQSLRLPHTYRPPLLPTPAPAHCQGSQEATATLSPGSLLPLHGGVRVPLHCTHALVHRHMRPCWCCAGVCARAALARPGLAQSHLRACLHIPCVSTDDAQAAWLHKQGQRMRMHACCIMGISLQVLITVSHAQGDTLLSLPVAVVGMLLSHPRGGVTVSPHHVQFIVSSLCSCCPFLTSSIISPHFSAVSPNK